MRPARSRRVQAQRKFAQGAYVPPNVAAAAPADNRRDTTQDRSNVTRNHMTASNLLDVVSLQSASSSPERQSMHYHLTSQPVVLVERLRGRQTARVESPPSSRDSSHPALSESQDEIFQPKPVEGPRLRTAKKAKEYKRVHAMSLRSRRLSKLQLNKLLAENSGTPRKVTFKRKRHSSDEDEPLIFQKNKNKKTSSKFTLQGVAAKEGHPLVGILKQGTPLMNVSKHYTPKNPLSPVKQSVPRKQSTHKILSDKKNAPTVCTPENGSPEKSPKKKHPKKCSTEQPKKNSLDRSSPELSSREVSPKKLLPKNKAVEQGSPKKQHPKNTVEQGSPVLSPKKKLPRKTISEESSLQKYLNKKQDKKSTTFDKKKSRADITPLKKSKTKLVIILPESSATVGANANQVQTDESTDFDRIVTNRDKQDDPVVSGDRLDTDSTVASCVRDAADDRPIPSVQVNPNNEDHVPTGDRDEEDIPLHINDNIKDPDPASKVNVNDERNNAIDAEEDEEDIWSFLAPVNSLNKAVSKDRVVEEPVASTSGMNTYCPMVLSPEPRPGPSGLQYQFSSYDSDNDEKVDFFSDSSIYLEEPELNEQYIREVMHQTAISLELERTKKLQKKTCIGASLRSAQDVIKASKELLDSRCKVCKPCVRINKLLKLSSLVISKIELTDENTGQDSNTDAADFEPGRREEEHEDNEEPPERTDGDQGYLYLDLLPKQSRLIVKIGTNVQHGRSLLSVCLIPRSKSGKMELFLLEEKESILDNLIETLTISQESENTDITNGNAATVRENVETRNDNTEGRMDRSHARISNPVGRTLSISSDSDLSDSGIIFEQQKPNRVVQHHKMMAARRRLAKAKMMQDHIRQEKEKEIAHIEEQKRKEISRIMAEKTMCEAEISRYQERFTTMQQEKEREFARLKMQIREKVREEMEADRSMIAEVDDLAKLLENEKDAKNMNPEYFDDFEQPSCSGLVPMEGGVLVDAPVYHPTLEEFADPLIFYEKIWPEAVRFGICKIVPPIGWNPPPHKVHDDMRFDVTNQYISRLFSRWGPAARELCAIKLCLQQQKIVVTRLPCLDGVEVNLPKLYHLVQRHGGLETVINKKRWGRVAEDMKFTRGPITERRLDQIYVKFLLPYDTLSHQERQEIMAKVEMAWHRKNQKLLDRAMNPLYRQKRMLGLQEESEEENEDPDTMVALKESEDCIIKGAVTTLAKFKKVATMTYENTFGQESESGTPPNLKDVEEEYWRLVTHGAEHTCVNSAAIDTGEEGYGFTKNKNEPYGLHPWNPKMVSQNPRNVLSYLDSIIGLTIPTLLLGMLYSTSCWHKDPHAIAWIEYQHEGPARIWYAIPDHQADTFRKAVEILSPTSVQNKSLWLPTDITMIPPNMLREHNVTLSRIEQNPGEFIMAFPNAYTCCISTGYTVSESVYFAPPSWLKRLWNVFKETRASCEPTMFAMEHLLYNIARDPTADREIVETAQPLFDRMLREEVTNRQMLQERGVSFVQELLSSEPTPSTSSGKKKGGKQYIPRDQEECEYCRATLYLSKVKGLTERNTYLCLEHALKVLESDKHKDTDVSQVQVLVHVSVKELNSVNDDMKRRLGFQ